jgi:hypothetical protein
MGSHQRWTLHAHLIFVDYKRKGLSRQYAVWIGYDADGLLPHRIVDESVWS